MADVETPLHPSAREAMRQRLIGEAFIQLNAETYNFRTQLEEFVRQSLFAQVSVSQLKPLSLITLSGV